MIPEISAGRLIKHISIQESDWEGIASQDSGLKTVLFALDVATSDVMEPEEPQSKG